MILKQRSYSIHKGSKVIFKAKGGVHIAGTFVQMKRKNATIMSMYDRNGLPRAHAVVWSVSPELLDIIPEDQVKFHVFP